jgi:hypothetical protein
LRHLRALPEGAQQTIGQFTEMVQHSAHAASAQRGVAQQVHLPGLGLAVLLAQAL